MRHATALDRCFDFAPAVLAWTTLNVLFTANSAAQGISRQLAITRPEDPQFESVVLSNYPSLAAVESYAAMRPYLVLLENNSGADAKGYTVVWTLTSPDGLTNHIVRQFVQKHEMSQMAAKVLHNGETRLVSIAFNATPTEYLATKQFGVRYSSRAFPLPPNVTVHADIDAAIYSDNVFVGPDHTHLKERYVCTRHAEHDEGAYVKHLFAVNKSIDDILTALEADVNAGLKVMEMPVWYPTPTSDPSPRYYADARGREAQMLLNLYHQQGLAMFRAQAERMARYPRENLVTAGR